MMQDLKIVLDQDVRFFSLAIEITAWTEDQIAEQFPGTAQLYAIADDNGRLFVHAATPNFGRASFLATIAENKSVKKDVGTRVVIVDGPLAVAQLLSALPAIIRDDCES